MQEFIFDKVPEVTEIHPLGVPSQETVWVCGRICCEAAEGKLNNSSVLLEGCVDDSNGRRVHLDLKDISSYSLFPGQIVLVQGVNSSGRYMIAQRIIEGVPRPQPLSTPAKLLEYHHSELYQGGAPVKVLVASGPFTTMQNLDFEPLDALLSKVFNDRPDVLILMGPFVDATHPLVKDGDIQLTNRDDDGRAIGQHSATYEMVFIEKVIRDGLTALFSGESDEDIIPTHIILVPSLADAHHEFVYPQPPFADRELDRIQTSFYEEAIGQLDTPFSDARDPKRRVHLMSNPCMFRCSSISPPLFGL
jgi:DNA polymerase alpha subunit B